MAVADLEAFSESVISVIGTYMKRRIDDLSQADTYACLECNMYETFTIIVLKPSCSLNWKSKSISVLTAAAGHDQIRKLVVDCLPTHLCLRN